MLYGVGAPYCSEHKQCNSFIVLVQKKNAKLFLVPDSWLRITNYKFATSIIIMPMRFMSEKERLCWSVRTRKDYYEDRMGPGYILDILYIICSIFQYSIPSFCYLLRKWGLNSSASGLRFCFSSKNSYV